MKENVIFDTILFNGIVTSGKSGPQNPNNNDAILDEKEFGIGITSVPGNPIGDIPPEEPIAFCGWGSGSATMEFEEDIIL